MKLITLPMRLALIAMIGWGVVTLTAAAQKPAWVTKLGRASHMAMPPGFENIHLHMTLKAFRTVRKAAEAADDASNAAAAKAAKKDSQIPTQGEDTLFVERIENHAFLYLAFYAFQKGRLVHANFVGYIAGDNAGEDKRMRQDILDQAVARYGRPTEIGVMSPPERAADRQDVVVRWHQKNWNSELSFVLRDDQGGPDFSWTIGQFYKASMWRNLLPATKVDEKALLASVRAALARAQDGPTRKRRMAAAALSQKEQLEKYRANYAK